MVTLKFTKIFFSSKSGRNRLSVHKQNMFQSSEKLPGTFVCFSALTVKIGSTSLAEIFRIFEECNINESLLHIKEAKIIIKFTV